MSTSPHREAAPEVPQGFRIGTVPPMAQNRVDGSRAGTVTSFSSKEGDQMRGFVLCTGLLLIGLVARPVAAQVDCQAARCAIQSAISQCPCDTSTTTSNHGKYVSCVAHAVRDQARLGTIPTNCKGKVTRCAARSICGRPAGAVVCQIPTDTCDLTTSMCTGDPTVTCATDIDCGSRCTIKSSSDLCATRGGVVDPIATTCCPGCG